MLWLKVCLGKWSFACFMMLSTMGLDGSGRSETCRGVALDLGFLRLARSFSRLLGTAVQPLSSMVFDMLDLWLKVVNSLLMLGGLEGCCLQVDE